MLNVITLNGPDAAGAVAATVDGAVEDADVPPEPQAQRRLSNPSRAKLRMSHADARDVPAGVTSVACRSQDSFHAQSPLVG